MEQVTSSPLSWLSSMLPENLTPEKIIETTKNTFQALNELSRTTNGKLIIGIYVITSIMPAVAAYNHCEAKCHYHHCTHTVGNIFAFALMGPLTLLDDQCGDEYDRCIRYC